MCDVPTVVIIISINSLGMQTGHEPPLYKFDLSENNDSKPVKYQSEKEMEKVKLHPH
jgi:hypothetical protein